MAEKELEEQEGQEGEDGTSNTSNFLKATAGVRAAAPTLLLHCNDFRGNSAAATATATALAPNAGRESRGPSLAVRRPRPSSLAVPANILLSVKPRAGWRAGAWRLLG